MQSVDDVVVFLGDFNGHVGKHIDRLDGLHGRYGVDQRNM